MTEKPNYEVGFGRPPKSSQFQKGQSGNPKGRPRGSQNMTSIVKDELDRKHRVDDHSGSRLIPIRQILVRRQIAKAAQGCPKAFLVLLKLEAEAEAVTARHTREDAGSKSELSDADYSSIIDDFLNAREHDGEGGA